MILSSFIEFVFHIVLIVYQSKAVFYYQQLSPSLINFAVENKCSDGPLMQAFIKLNGGLKNEIVALVLGLVFTLLSLIIQVCTCLTQTTFRECCFPCKCCEIEPIDSEEQAIKRDIAKIDEVFTRPQFRGYR